MFLTRSELKTKAKAVLSTKYWQIFAVLLAYELIPTLVLPSMNFLLSVGGFLSALVVILVGGVLIFTMAVSIFVISPLYMAVCRFVLKSSTQDESAFAEIWKILKEDYFNLVKAGFMRDLFLLLWAIPYVILVGMLSAFIMLWADNILIIAGLALGVIFSLILLLYKSYSYSMVNYVMAEYPETEWREAIAESKSLMKGKTFFSFKLDLSFLGWQILGFLAFGIGTYFVQPYTTATQAQLYLALKDERKNIL